MKAASEQGAVHSDATVTLVLDSPKARACVEQNGEPESAMRIELKLWQKLLGAACSGVGSVEAAE